MNQALYAHMNNKRKMEKKSLKEIKKKRVWVTVWEWSLNLAFLLSLNGYHYKQERGDMFGRLCSQ
jgi:hypothetical protein